MINLAGQMACGISTQDDAYCWGAGPLGNGVETKSPLPLLVAGGLDWSTIAAGAATCGVTFDSRAYCWGQNSAGQLGVPIGSVTCGNGGQCSSTPVAVDGNLTFSSIASSGEMTCGLTMDGSAYCWGAQAGAGRTTTSQPTLIAGGYHFTSLGMRDGACGLIENGDAYCWGILNELTVDGQSIAFSETPLRSQPSFALKQLVVSRRPQCGIDLSDKLYCWDPYPTLSPYVDFWSTLEYWSFGPLRLVIGQ